MKAPLKHTGLSQKTTDQIGNNLLSHKETQTAKRLFTSLFSFDSLSQYPLNFDRGYWEKLSRKSRDLLIFPQLKLKKLRVYIKISFHNKKRPHCRDPPQISESNRIQIFGGIEMTSRRIIIYFHKNFSIPESTFQVIPLVLGIGSNCEGVRT